MARNPYKARISKGATQRAEEDVATALSPRDAAIRDATMALDAAKRALKIKRARVSLRDFIELMMPDPEFPDDSDKSLFDCEPHHRILIDMVEAIECKKMLRAATSMPPQHGKSLILSRFGLAWIIGRNPHLRVLFATYADTLAETRGDELRATLQDRLFREIFPKAEMKRGSQSKSEMVFVAGGSINLLGRGSGATGRPCDLFVIDDPYKDEIEASSETIRRSVQEWYSTVAQTRCPVWAPILLVHTRWNEDDLIGWLCEESHPANKANPARAKRWKYINLPTPVRDPALAKALGCEVGAALWAKRFPLHHLQEIRENNPRTYAALYEGQPAPEDGDFFKAEHFLTYLPDELPPKETMRFYAASDHAVSEKQRADASCFIVAGVDKDDNVWVVDCWWERKATNVAVEAMIDLMKKWEPLWWRAASDHISKSVGPFLRQRMQERKVYGNIVESPETGDKVRKAQAIQARMSMKKVRFPAAAHWTMQAKAELLKFPHGKHDDFVDALGHLGRGLRVMASGPGLRVATENGVPRVGSLAWTKHAATQEKRGDEVTRRLRVM